MIKGYDKGKPIQAAAKLMKFHSLKAILKAFL